MTDIKETTVRVCQKFKTSLTVKFITIAVVILLLLIPSCLTQKVTKGRKITEGQVIEEIASKWGQSQTITGPFIYTRTPAKTKVISDRNTVITPSKTLTLLPDTLSVTGFISPEVRHRGIYQAILYQSELVFEGIFIVPEVHDAIESPTLLIGLSDIKGLRHIDLTINDKTQIFNAGVVTNPTIETGLQCFLTEAFTNGEFQVGKPTSFKMKLSFNGSSALHVKPIARNFKMQITSPWASPSFDGSFLPKAHDINDEGFSAQWELSSLVRNYPQYWFNKDNRISNESCGVTLLELANTYQQVTRTEKYAVLFLVIILFTLLVTERLAKVWMHPLQYFIAGLSLVLFQLLLLALAEQMAFPAAYACAALIITTMMGVYSASIFRCIRIGSIIGGVMLATYGILFVILRLENLALIVGSLILVLVLSALMLLTSRMNQDAG